MHSSERALVRSAVWLVGMAFGASAAAQVPIVVANTPAEDTAAAVADPNWKVPRTSWGHPSLEGVYSTDDMRSVPRDRPEEIETREKLTPEEFAKRAQDDANERDRVLNKASYSSNSVGSRTFGWTSQIIDPPNGRMPALSAEGEARRRPNDRGSYGAGPFDTFEDFHLYDRCITRGILGSAFAVVYGNGIRIAQSPDSVLISYEMLADSRVIPLVPAARAGFHQAVSRQFSRLLGRRHARRRDEELQRQDQYRRQRYRCTPQRSARVDGTPPQSRPRHDRVSRHGRTIR